jgi:hypothetical protein
MAIGAGALIGLAVLFFALRDAGPISAHRVEIAVDGVPVRMSRDLLLPAHGFTLQVVFDPPIDPAHPPELVVELREERTGLTIEIQDRLVLREEFATFTVPESLGISEGLLAVGARATFTGGDVAQDWRRIRIRPFFGGPPIGARQIIHFDFTIDRDGDGRPDFEHDLEGMGLASPESPELVRSIAASVAARALARVKRAYDAPGDPNRTGLERDPVAVRFQLAPAPLESDRPYSTRICVGGRDPMAPGSVGHVRFDLGNARRASDECVGESQAGLFPAELGIYRESALHREVFAPFDAAAGGVPFGEGAGDSAPGGTRREQIERAVAVLGDVLGTLMAHEAGHTLGLVAPGKPGAGLFGGETGEAFAHAITPDGEEAALPSLMDRGRRFSFEELAGVGGELHFRPLDYAYLRDRVVLQADKRAKNSATPVVAVD